MDIEQLKLILETVQGITGDAKSAAIWWMALHYGLQILNHLLVAGVIITVVLLIVRTIRHHDDDEKFITEMRNAMRLGYGYLGLDERMRTHAAIRKLVSKHWEPENGTNP
jgi:hypothetical protein